MDREQLSKAFAATVQASLHGLQSLRPVLEREQDALTGKDPETLIRLSREKLDLLKQLEHSVQARDRMQQSAGLAAGLAEGGKLVAELGQAALSEDWQALEELARTVAALNDRNGQLAMQGQRTTRTALGILTGRPENEDTYRTLRRRRSGVTSYTLGKV